MKWCLVILLVGCSSKAPSTPAEAPVAPVPIAATPVDAALVVPDAARPDAPPPQTCPADLADAKGSCTTELTCSYGTTTCYCTRPQHCGGAAWGTEDDKGRGWSCVVPPPLVRADGCPGAEPKAGTVCKVAANKVCTYGGCTCFDSFSCVEKAWVAGEIRCVK